MKSKHRSYLGAVSRASARRTGFREIPSSRAIALVAIPSDLRSRRIPAQSSTVITLHGVTQVGHFQSSLEGKSSLAVDTART
jgi:hypothetical protein